MTILRKSLIEFWLATKTKSCFESKICRLISVYIFSNKYSLTFEGAKEGSVLIQKLNVDLNLNKISHPLLLSGDELNWQNLLITFESFSFVDNSGQMSMVKSFQPGTAHFTISKMYCLFNISELIWIQRNFGRFYYLIKCINISSPI